MELTLRDQQIHWRHGNTRSNPASEGELLAPERRLGNLVMKTRPRILGLFTFSVNNVPIPIHELLPNQQLAGVTVVGVLSTILGQEGLHAQTLSYRPDAPFDWYWASITNVRAIEVRVDSRFRGGTKCVWLVTPIAEYAVAIPHPTYNHQWENALAYFDAPRLEKCSLTDDRPLWWPAESAGLWPGKKQPWEETRILTPEEELRYLTEQLSFNPASAPNSFPRLGNHGYNRFPGQPRHHLYQLQPWELRYDGGIKVTRDQPGDSPAELEEEEGEIPPAGRGGKRKTASHGGRRVRWRK